MIVRAFRNEITTTTKKKLVERTYEYSYVRSGTEYVEKKKEKESRMHAR